MALIEINKNPSKGELRWFGLLFLLFWGIVGAIVYWKRGSADISKYLWGLGAIVAVLDYAVPPLRLPIC